MKRFKKYLYTSYVFVGSFVLPKLLFAAPALDSSTKNPLDSVTRNPASTSTINNPLKADTISQLLNDVYSVVIQIGVPIAVIMLIYTGFLFVTARGIPDKITDARRAFLWTCIGIAVLLGASTIAFVIQSTIDQIKS